MIKCHDKFSISQSTLLSLLYDKTLEIICSAKTHSFVVCTLSSILVKGEGAAPKAPGAGDWLVLMSSLLMDKGDWASVRLSSAAASPKMVFCCCLLFSFFLRLFLRTRCTSNSSLSAARFIPFFRSLKHYYQLYLCFT